MRSFGYLASVLIASQVFTAGAQAGADPFALYGDEIRFDIVRKGKAVGSHVVTFRGNAEAIETRSEVNIAIDVLFFTAFRYKYEATARWDAGLLRQLNVGSPGTELEFAL